MDDLDGYEDLDATMAAAFDPATMGADGSYSVKHQGEKFKLVGMPVKKSDNPLSGSGEALKKQASTTSEDRFMAEQLAAIRKQEEAEQLASGNQLEMYVKSGEYVYELFAILIHSGSALGGHYYAYIKSSSDAKWYNFNDSSVTALAEKNVNDEIAKMFGGNATSAYMLEYRRHDASKWRDGSHYDEVPDDLIPDYQKVEIEAER